MLLLQMKSYVPVFAQAGYAIRDAFLVLGILAVLVGSIFMLTLFIKDRSEPQQKKKSRHRRRSSRNSSFREESLEAEKAETGDDKDDESLIRVKEVTVSEDGTRKRRKFRKRKKDHRPTNPTLAETGGLPPCKSERSGDSTA